jgi:hypothetical protein
VYKLYRNLFLSHDDLNNYTLSIKLKLPLCLIKHHVMQTDVTYDIVKCRPVAKQQLCGNTTAVVR